MTTFKDQIRLGEQLSVRVKVHRQDAAHMDSTAVEPMCASPGCTERAMAFVGDVPCCQFHVGPTIQREMGKRELKK